MQGAQHHQLLNTHDYEHLQFYGQAVRHPHARREQERGREEAPGARRSR